MKNGTPCNGNSTPSWVIDENAAVASPESPSGSDSIFGSTVLEHKRGRKTNQLHYIRTHIMPCLFKYPSSLYFRQPVDVLSLLNYSKFVKIPMDLRTIRNRLNETHYWSSADCIKDFHLMFCNCYLYNDPGSFIVKEARDLEKRFLAKLLEIPEIETDLAETNSCENGAGEFFRIKTPSRRSSRCSSRTSRFGDSSDEEDTEYISKKEQKERRMSKIGEKIKKLQQELSEMAKESTDSDSSSVVQVNDNNLKRKSKSINSNSSRNSAKESSPRKSTSKKFKPRTNSYDNIASETGDYDHRNTPTPQDIDLLEHDVCLLCPSNLTAVMHLMKTFRHPDNTQKNSGSDAVTFDGLESHQFWEVKDLVSSFQNNSTFFKRSPRASPTSNDSESIGLNIISSVITTNVPLVSDATEHTQPENGHLSGSDEDDFDAIMSMY